MVALTTLVVAAFVLLVGPAPGDAPAHLHRTLLVRDGSLLWDNLWYSGNYPLASYSLLYYLPAAVVGNLPLVVASACASSVLFRAIAVREWGEVALWPARVFAVLAAAPAFTGLYPYSVGFTAMLAALLAMQHRRPWVAGVLSAVTYGLSPLAFVFLALILAAAALGRRGVSLRLLAAGGAIVAVPAAVGLLVMAAFPSGGVYSFHPLDFGCVLATAIGGTLLARRSPQARTLAALFVLWGILATACFILPTPLGDNVTRLRSSVFPLVLVAAALVRFRPRLPVAIALAGALAYSVVPHLILVPYRLDARPETERFWAPAVELLSRANTPDHRIEVVPTAAHWESYWLPRAGLPLARGWYRQLDMAHYPVLFRQGLDADAYARWLRDTGVRYVLLPATKLDPVGGPAEARLLRGSPAHFRTVAVTGTGTVYELVGAEGIVTGPAAAKVTRLGQEVVEGTVAAPGTYRVRIRHSPYWVAGTPGACVRASSDGTIELELPAAGPFRISFTGGVREVVEWLVANERPGPPCAGGSLHARAGGS